MIYFCPSIANVNASVLFQRVRVVFKYLKRREAVQSSVNVQSSIFLSRRSTVGSYLA